MQFWRVDQIGGDISSSLQSFLFPEIWSWYDDDDDDEENGIVWYSHKGNNDL